MNSARPSPQSLRRCRDVELRGRHVSEEVERTRIQARAKCPPGAESRTRSRGQRWLAVLSCGWSPTHRTEEGDP